MSICLEKVSCIAQRGSSSQQQLRGVTKGGEVFSQLLIRGKLNGRFLVFVDDVCTRSLLDEVPYGSRVALLDCYVELCSGRLEPAVTSWGKRRTGVSLSLFCWFSLAPLSTSVWIMRTSPLAAALDRCTHVSVTAS